MDPYVFDSGNYTKTPSSTHSHLLLSKGMNDQNLFDVLWYIFLRAPIFSLISLLSSKMILKAWIFSRDGVAGTSVLGLTILKTKQKEEKNYLHELWVRHIFFT